MSVTGFLNASNKKDFILTTYEKTSTSSAQPKFAFSKAQRFPTIKSSCPVTAYES